MNGVWPGALLSLLLGARALSQECPGCAPVAGDCSGEPEVLVAMAEDLLLEASGAARLQDPLAEARQLYRRARLLNSSSLWTLRAAELAEAAGDQEEAMRLLAEAAGAGTEWLSPPERVMLARHAEARGERKEAITLYEAALRAFAANGEHAAWIEERIRRLEVEEEARSMETRVPPAPSPEARLAFTQAKRDLEEGRMGKARERLRLSLRLSPGYVEAALALAALEARQGRTREAIRAYRGSLSADPNRLEALVSLSSLLWAEPDRRAKQESLTLLDRAVSLRPDLSSLLRQSAERWAEWGDAAKALERLEAYRRRASGEERRATDGLRNTLALRVAGREATEPEPLPQAPDLSSPAIEPWKMAQVYFQRGDERSLAAALELLSRAEKLDPTFASAPELTAAIHEKHGDLRLAEKALIRALLAEPTRASLSERLALLLMRQPGRLAEAEESWRRAEEAGSSEALFYLADAAGRSHRRTEAAQLYRRYLERSPDGPHAGEARRMLQRLARQARFAWGLGLAGLVALLLFLGVRLLRRRTGLTFEEWLARDSTRAHEIRPILGRLRHEAIKHGGLLLRDGVLRLKETNPKARRDAAQLLRARLFGLAEEETRRGLLAEAFRALEQLQALAREDGYRLNLRFRDPVLSPIIGGLHTLRKTENDLLRIETRPETVSARILSRLARRLEKAAPAFEASTGNRLGRILDAASTTRVRLGQLEKLLGRVAAEKQVAPAPRLEPLGLFREEPSPPLAVRVEGRDWETIWRNLFTNALLTGKERRAAQPQLGLLAERCRDPITGQPLARFVLADNVPGALTADMIRGRAADRGWGVVADLVRRHDGRVDVGPPPDGTAAYHKGIILEFPALEP